MNEDTVPINTEPQIEKPIDPIKNTTQLVDNNKKSIIIPLGKVKLTRKVSDLLIIFRTNIDILIWDQSKKRIFEADKIEYSKRCLISLIKSMKSLSSLRNDIKLKLPFFQHNIAGIPFTIFFVIKNP